MRQMKENGAPDVDVTKAVAELKARKKTLEAKVRLKQILFIEIGASNRSWLRQKPLSF